MKKPKRINKHNLTKLQDDGHVVANSIATQAIKDFGLEKMHKTLTK